MNHSSRVRHKRQEDCVCRLQDEAPASVVGYVHLSFRICDIDGAVWRVVEAGFNRMRRISNIGHATATPRASPGAS